MAGGYAGKFLEVNLTHSEIKDITVEEEVLRKYLGGRALAAKIFGIDWDKNGVKWIL